MVDTVRVRRGLTLVLAIALVVSVGGMVYFAANPPTTAESFTEFYVLGSDGEATGYPTDLSVDETGTVIVGVTNHEQRTAEYTAVMRFEGRTIGERQIQLDDGETWEDQMSFTPRSTGEKQLQLLLYQGEVSGDAYRSLRLWVQVDG
jgi:uncharacterized membrane protein